MDNIIDHPTSYNARSDRDRARENLARQLRTNQMMRESARERINASQIIDDIHVIDTQLMGSHTEGTKEVIDPETGLTSLVNVEVQIPLEREIISALKARADIKFRLLGKVLPDLKSTESISHSIHDHAHTIHTPISDVEMATRLQLWQKDIRGRTIKEINPVLINPVLIEHKPTPTPQESCVEATFEEQYL